jgi:hypothetical protein
MTGRSFSAINMSNCCWYWATTVGEVLNNNKPAKNMKTKQNNQLLMKRTQPCSWLRRGMAAGVAALACVSIANAHPYAVYR